MKTGPTKVASTSSTPLQQENNKNTRRTLKVLQESADNKENLIGRSRITKDIKLDSDISNDPDVKRKKLVHKAVQTGETVITVKDLTSEEEPSEDYWRLLAEKRGEALNESLQENERLKEHIEALTNENEINRKMIEESRNLVEALKEMIGYVESDSDAEEGRERA